MIEQSGVPDLAWAKDIAGLGDEEIRDRLKSLPAETQARVVVSLNWRDRLRIIALSDRAGEVVRALPEQEVLLTVKGVGVEDALPLVGLTTPGQLRFLLDVELWKRDAIDGGKVVEWMNYILSCGEDKVVEFATTADIELLALMLKHLVTLVPNEEGIAATEGLPSIMPDEFFTIVANIPGETESTKLFLRILRQADRDLFYRLLFMVYGSAGAEMEEDALRWRNARLDGFGILDFGEAIEIYAYVSEADALALAGSSPIEPPIDGKSALAPSFPVRLNEVRTFLSEVLASVKDSALASRLRHDLAFSANRILVADADHIGEIDSMRKAVERLFALANVGILFLTDGDRDEAARILRAVSVHDLFQIGFSRASDLKVRASALARRWWPGWARDGFVFLGLDQDAMLRGLMMRVPQYRSAGGAGGPEFRDFRTMAEIRETAAVVDEIAAVAETAFETLGIPRPEDAKIDSRGVFADGLEDIALGNLMLTGFVHYCLDGQFSIEPLGRRELDHFLREGFEVPSEGGRRIRAGRIHDFLSHLAGLTRFDPARAGRLEAFIRRGLETLEAETGRIPSAADVDPRYVRSLVLSRPWV